MRWTVVILTRLRKFSIILKSKKRTINLEKKTTCSRKRSEGSVR